MDDCTVCCTVRAQARQGGRAIGAVGVEQRDYRWMDGSRITAVGSGRTRMAGGGGDWSEGKDGSDGNDGSDGRRRDPRAAAVFAVLAFAIRGGR